MKSMRILIMVATIALVSPARSEEIHLKFAVNSPPTSGFATEFCLPWAQRVSAASQGSLVVDPIAGQTLANFNNIYDRIMNDVVQVGMGLHNFVGGKFTLTEVAGLPFMCNSAEECAIALSRLYKLGMLDSEYDESIPLMQSGFPQGRLHLSRTPATLDNLNGLKIMVTNKVQGDALAHLGAVAIALPINDMYPSLQRDTVQGVTMAWPAVASYKAGEVANFHVDTTLGSSTSFILMSKKTYAALPEAARKALDGNGREAESRAFGAFWDRDAERARGEVMALKNNQRLVTLSAAQDASWRARIAPVVEDWERARPERAAVLAKFKALLADVRAGR